MRKIISAILVLIVALTSFSASAAEPENTNAKEQFKEYISGIYGTDNYMNYEELGQVGEYTYVYGAASEATDTFYTAVLGDYVFNKFYIASPYKLGLYIITDETVYPLESAYGAGIITDEDLPTIASLTQRANTHKMDVFEKLTYEYLKDNDLYSSSNYSYSYVGSIGSRYVAAAKTNDLEYSEVIGDYTVCSETNPWLFAMGTQLFIVGDIELEENLVWSLKEACDEGIVDVEDVKKLCESKNVSGVHFVPYVPETEPSSSEPAEEVTVYDRIKRAIMKDDSYIQPEDITIDYFYELSNGMSLVHYELADCAYDCAIHNDWIGKYLYTYNHGGADKKLFDGNNLYSLRNAYKYGIIGNSDLKEISSVLSGMKEYTKTLEAGESSYIVNDFIDGFKVSDTKVLKLDRNDGTITALSKGTVTVTAKIGNGKTCTCKVKVTTDPKLTKGGKAIKSVKVKKGSTVKVRIIGKVRNVDNKYTGTKHAKIIAKKSDTVIKIKGVKKGTSNLKITVNGKKLTLKTVVR